MTPLETNTSKIQEVLDLVNNLPSVGVQLPTLTNPASAAQILNGYEAIDETGAKLTGTIDNKSASNVTASGATVTVPAGYYPSQVSKSVATATQATPSITVSSAGLITASATQTAGYVSSGTKSATKQLTTKAATTYTPGTSNQTIANGTYLTGTQTIKGDSNLVAANIKSGVSIFGVTGSMSAGMKAIYKTTAAPWTNNNNQSYTITFECGFSPKGLMAYQELFGCIVYDGSSVTYYPYYSNSSRNPISGSVALYSTGVNFTFSSQTMGTTHHWIAFG